MHSKCFLLPSAVQRLKITFAAFEVKALLIQSLQRNKWTPFPPNSFSRPRNHSVGALVPWQHVARCCSSCGLLWVFSWGVSWSHSHRWVQNPNEWGRSWGLKEWKCESLEEPEKLTGNQGDWFNTGHRMAPGSIRTKPLSFPTFPLSGLQLALLMPKAYPTYYNLEHGTGSFLTSSSLLFLSSCTT